MEFSEDFWAKFLTLKAEPSVHLVLMYEEIVGDYCSFYFVGRLLIALTEMGLKTLNEVVYSRLAIQPQNQPLLENGWSSELFSVAEVELLTCH